MGIYSQLRAGKYSFVVYDPKSGKRRRLAMAETGSITSKDSADAFCQHWEDKHGSQRTKIKERLSWQDQYPAFEKFTAQYEIDRKEEAPYSANTSLYYLKYYALPFFLSMQEEPNMNKWQKHFEDFRDYLRTKPSIKQMSDKRQTLSYSTMNGVIKALNSFMTVMYRRAKLTKPLKCRLFPKKKLNDKSLNSVISKNNQAVIFNQLMKQSPMAADMFKVLIGTGLRINELLGLSLADFFPGETKSEVLNNTLKPYGWKVYGYISLESQPELSPPRDENGRVPRKPLKNKDKIGGKDSRTVPILDREVFNALVRYWNSQLEEFKHRTYGGRTSDYLLFDGAHRHWFYTEFIRAQKEAEIVAERIFTPHDCRHTFCTDLAIKTGGNFTICKIALGHSSLDVTMHYCHIGEQANKEVRLEHQLASPLMEIA